MPPKRSRVSGSSSSGSNISGKFVSEEARQRFEHSRLHRTILAERGFHLNRRQSLCIRMMIENRNWELFCAQPKAGVVPIVREFYANAKEGNERMAFVRGKLVPFGEAVINEMFDLPEIEDGAYDALRAELDFNLILRELCIEGAVWKDVGTVMTKYLRVVPSLWYAFLVCRLMPVSHVSDVTKDWLVLLYAIVKGIPLNVGRIISAHIFQCAHNQYTKIFFPTIITELCARIGVNTGADDEWIQPQQAIDEKILSSKKDTRAQLQAGGSSSAAVQPRRRPVTTKVDELFAWAEVQSQYMTNFDAMMRDIATHLGMDTSIYPQPPPFPSLLHSQGIGTPPEANARVVPPEINEEYEDEDEPDDDE